MNNIFIVSKLEQYTIDGINYFNFSFPKNNLVYTIHYLNTNLNMCKKSDLMTIAKELKIKYYYTISKRELIKEIQNNIYFE